MKKLTLGCVAALALPAVAIAAPEPKSIPFDATGPFDHVDGSGPARDANNILLHQRSLSSTSASSAAISQDVGDVAVLVDNGSIIVQPSPASPLDLSQPTTVTFSPAGGSNFDLSTSGAGIIAPVGANLGVGDDDTINVAFPAGFPYLGTTYFDIWVNSDGNVTLGAGDGASTARDAGRHVSGPPRISAMFMDTDPTSGGSVHADADANKIVITWSGVPQFGVADSNTMQAVLHTSGQIDITLDGVAANFGIVGIAAGGGDEPFNEVDLSASPAGPFKAGAIFEEFAPAVVGKQFNIIAAANEFYKTHDDKYDFLVFFTDWVPNLGGAFAFHQGVQNQTNGLGFFRGTFDASSIAGSDGELESLLMMNRIGLYWPDAGKLVDPPIKKFRFNASVPGATLDGPPGAGQTSRRARRMGTLGGDFGGFGAYTLGLNSAMSIMAQEAGHRWLAFPLFWHPTTGCCGDAFDLTGRANAHWSFFFNVRVPAHQFDGAPRASSEEGNAIREFGEHPACLVDGQTLFQTEPDELIDGFTELDQHLMGLRAEADVSSFWYVDNPTSVFSNNAGALQAIEGFSAQDDIFFCGNKVDLNVSDITLLGNLFGNPANGPRNPVVGDEVDQDAGGNDVADVKTMAFILVTEQVPGQKSSAVSQVDTFRKTWEEYGNGAATDGLGRFDTSLDPDVY